MENEFITAVTARTAAFAERSAARAELKDAHRRHAYAARRLPTAEDRRIDPALCARVEAFEAEARAEMDQAHQRLAEAELLVARAAEFTAPFLSKGSGE